MIVRRPFPRRLAAILGTAVLAWTAISFARAVDGFRERWSAPPRAVGVTAWNPGEYASNRLAGFLAAVEPRIPPGRVVLFSAPSAGAEGELFLSLWAAYHLPRHRVIRARHPASAAGEYLIVFASEPGTPPPRAGAALRHPAGVLYRLPPESR